MSESGKITKLTKLVKTSGCAAKLPPSKLHEVIDSLPLTTSEKLLGGFESSDDALVYRVKDDIVAIETLDFFPPMVDDPYIFGEVAAANALSDIYAMGGEPAVAMNLLCFPSCLDLSVMRAILEGGLEKVREAGAVIAGGHTISDPTPKYGLSVTAFMKESEVWKNNSAKAGDAVVLTKALGVGILNTAIKGEMASEEAEKAVIESMTTLNKRARDIARRYKIDAATDVTGFALAGHSYEVASSSGVSIVYDTSALPILTDALELARYGLLPEGMYTNLDYVAPHVSFSDSLTQEMKDLVVSPETSGGLLLFMDKRDAESFVKEFALPCCRIIGEVVEKRDKAVIFK